MIKQITIGRHYDNDIVIHDNRVSGHHCRVYEDNGAIYVEDTNSTNGVKVNGARISEPTQIAADTQVVLPTKTFTGAELIDCLQKFGGSYLKKSQVMEAKYDSIERRYQNNMSMLCEALHIESYPYTRVFASIDEEIEYNVKEYEQKIEEAISMLKLISKSSQVDVVTFHDDIDVLASFEHKAPAYQKAECKEVRMRIFEKVTRLQKNLCRQINDVVKQFTSHYLSVFTEYYETASGQDKKWQSVKNDQLVSEPYFLYGSQDVEYPLFEQSCIVKRLQFIPFIKRNNLVIRYNSAKAGIAQDVVNGIIGRMFASSRSGNVQLHMVDVKDLGGTSNMLKMLDKHVYSICARSSDVIAELAQLDRYIEDVVQNLLYGPYASLEQYNQGKEKQEPYHVVVFKEFPFGVTQEAAHTIQRILVNGSKVGIYFIFMLNEDYLQRSEECNKIAKILHVDSPQELFAQCISLQDSSLADSVTQHYATLDDKQLHEVVMYVNAGFEIKTDEVLRLTDYMIPKDEWWTKHSANRADIPFGMSVNKQIQKLNITQESGQNSAIVIGIPGSGKSVFLHVLIANAMVNYSPKELQMYLLDFSGVEFDVYARHNLPHARVIAPEAEREFGLSILREVFEEGNRRMTLCRENGVTNIVELKRKNPDLVVPRLLIIIDEFQKIFEVENDKISQEANAKIHAIIQEYRKFGINLILATQKLPAKSIVPFDLIANRVVFKSDPNDFNNLIRWSHSTPQPRLLTGNCVYNNESGTEMSNNLTRSFFINASGELENLLDEVSAFANAHPELMDAHELRAFRSDELPEFTQRILSDRHIEHQDAPREVGVYMGESIAIAPCHVYVPLTKDSNNNILIIGGQPNVAKGIAYHTLLSEVAGHNEKSCNVILMNFMMEDDPMQNVFKSQMFSVISDFCNMQEAKSMADVQEFLTFIKDEVIDARKADPTLPLSHFFINIFDFQRARMFDGVGSRGDMQSDCARLLEYILKNGPMVGVFTVLQVDNLANLNRLCYGAQNMFCHRIALQMSEQDSDKIVGNQAANRLLVLNRPATNFRGLYYNNINNSITKFKPYRYELISNQW